MQLSESQQGPLTVLTLAGEVDLQTSPALREKLREKVAAKTSALALDFSAVAYIDSSGLATLVEYVRDAQPYAGKFALIAPQLRVQRVLELVRLNELLPAFPTLDAAQEAFAG